MRKSLKALGCIVAAAIPACTPADSAPVSKTWVQFVEAKKTGDEPILPDFSYAGYHYGERAIPDVEAAVFDVTTFGAVADDANSDEAAIRATIAAAEKGGGIVFFPPGQYLVNTDDDPGERIYIRRGHVVLRGSGEGAGGTTIRMVNHFPPTDPDKMYSTPRLFTFGPESPQAERLAGVTSDARRETFSLQVDKTEHLSPGRRVTLFLQSKEAVPFYFAPFSVQPQWTRTVESGITFTERHIIKSVDGNTVTFAEPIHTNIRAEHGWSLQTYDPIEEIGVEDIRFLGGWEQPFIHHRSALDDGGWSFIEFNHVANSWVRNCTFENMNHGIEIRSSAQVSVLFVTFTGWKGHFGIHTRGGYGVLGYGCIDDAPHHHGPSVGYQAVGSVYCRMDMGEGQRIDCHSTNPYATLLDMCDGGTLYGSGGPMAALPHHMGWYTLWNFHHPTAPPVPVYDFWREGQKEAFLRPIIVGIYGHPLEFNEKTLEVLESPGTPVEPESLYEAQMRLRFGDLPAWLKDAHKVLVKRSGDVARASEGKNE